MKTSPLVPALTLEEFSRALLRHSMKSTPQRVAVHQAMLALGHASAEEVVARIVSDGNARITRASVYNILTQMVSLGIYSQRLAVSGKMVFDVTRGSHLHLYDTFNGEWKDIDDRDLVATVAEKLSRRKFKGYKVDGVDISILCHPSHVKKRTK